jgi:hypothetical protein
MKGEDEMSKLTMFLAGVTVLTMAVVFAGCSGNGDTNPSNGSEQSQGDDADHGHPHGDEADHSHGPGDADHDHASAQKEEMLADLSPEDRELVEKQRTCPVGDGLLWGMGKPCKTTVTDSSGKEHVVFLCCDACEEELKANVDEYLAKLSK